jgi:hypothetical protein
MFSWVKTRLTEVSTWTGIGIAVVNGFARYGIMLPPETVNLVAEISAGIAAIVLLVISEKRRR